VAYGNAYNNVYGDLGGTPEPPPPGPPADPAQNQPRPVVHVGFATDPTIGGGLYLHWSDPLRTWDQALWAPADVWTDVTPWLQTFAYTRGATRVEGPIVRYEAGTATIVFDGSDGRFNGLNLAGPYTSGGRSLVRPMVPVRIGVAYLGATYWLWQGYADRWDTEYPAPTYARTTLTATDGQKVLGRSRRVARTTPVGAGEKAGARVHRILNSVNWPAADRVIATGTTTLQGTTLEGDALSELLLVQDTEIGSVYFDAVGRVVFKSRHATLTEATSTTTQGVFGSDRAAGELPYAAVAPAWTDEAMRNVWRIAREGGVPQEARDEVSIVENLESVHERTDLLMQTDAEALAYAQYGLAMTSQPRFQFEQLTVDPRAQPADLFPQVLTRDFGHRITVRSRPPGVGLVERDSYIRGISGEYRGTNQWGWTWTLQPAEVTSYLIWNSGSWNTSAWAL